MALDAYATGAIWQFSPTTTGPGIADATRRLVEMILSWDEGKLLD